MKMKWNYMIKTFTVMFGLAAILTACGGGAKETSSSPESASGTEVAPSETSSSNATVTETAASGSNGSEQTGSTTEESSSTDDGKIGKDSTLEELKQQYADKLGYIRIPLNDHPVRRVSEEGSKNINVANYSDAVVDMNAGVPIHSDSLRLIDDAFPFFTTVQAPDESYVTWEEATNLERAMVKTLFIAREGLLITEDAMKNKDYSSKSFQDSKDFFSVTAKFESMAPVAQHPYDITLTTLYDKARTSWGELAVMDPAKDEAAFAEMYTTVRRDANNAMGLLNALLSTNEEARIKEIYGEDK
ncbi:hypothetical protein C0Q44_00400 [Paenibacillus sp. PCH8]|uniref:hypothetical protein n=1 Tax=Paenibacillus sp. PCH8 TaxID=2066524 RepID=UPI000CF895CE|nr:hypothetical protein [Paenibacillus sp. PCH8]PQP83229.1 hypothetical protein C0Q44_00400 [Paenibacillus sp. PCH8]